MSEVVFQFNRQRTFKSLTCDTAVIVSGNLVNLAELAGKFVVIDTDVINGLRWKWVYNNDTALPTNTSEKVFSTYLQLLWDDHEMKEPIGFRGELEFTLRGAGEVVTKHVPFEVTSSGEWIGVRNMKVLRDGPSSQQYTLIIRGSCQRFYETIDLDEILRKFAKGESTDGQLSIDGKLLHVNKSFLSFHSEYFQKLFSSNFKEITLDAIAIKNVSWADFTRLLSLIYPEPIEPTAETVDRYLELADMYLLPAATRQCEAFLLHSPRVKDIRRIELADKYGLEKLLKSTLSSVGTLEELKALTRLPEFSKLSNDTKAAFMERFMHFF